MDQMLLELGKAGPAWILTAYLLWSKSKSEAAQIDLNIKVASTLSSIRTLLAARYGVSNLDDAEK